MKQKFIALAKEGKYFETNPKANLFLFTEDGNAFGEADRHEAISHATKLGSQAHVITRSDVQNPRPEAPSIREKISGMTASDFFHMDDEEAIEILEFLDAQPEGELTKVEADLLAVIRQKSIAPTAQDVANMAAVEENERRIQAEEARNRAIAEAEEAKSKAIAEAEEIKSKALAEAEEIKKQALLEMEALKNEAKANTTEEQKPADQEKVQEPAKDQTKKGGK